MKILTGTAQFHIEDETAVAIGKFDGIHLGHRRLLGEILAQKECGRKACVFTFDPAPSVLFGTGDGLELTTLSEKRKLLEEMGVDILVEFPLTRQTASTEPERFVREILVSGLNAAFVAAGSDVSFGAGGAGNRSLLERMGRIHHFLVSVIDKVCLEGEEVSSTRIRGLVEQADMERAALFLGAPYSIAGLVEPGNRIGRRIGFPTLNLAPSPGKLLPPNGVYFTRVYLEGRVIPGVSNLGCKPTVESRSPVILETHLYGALTDRERYGEPMRVELLKFHRPERVFESVEGLRRQLERDIEAGMTWHGIENTGEGIKV